MGLSHTRSKEEGPSFERGLHPLLLRVCGWACFGSYDPTLVPEAPVGFMKKDSKRSRLRLCFKGEWGRTSRSTRVARVFSACEREREVEVSQRSWKEREVKEGERGRRLVIFVKRIPYPFDNRSQSS